LLCNLINCKSYPSSISLTNTLLEAVVDTQLIVKAILVLDILYCSHAVVEVILDLKFVVQYLVCYRNHPMRYSRYMVCYWW